MVYYSQFMVFFNKHNERIHKYGKTNGNYVAVFKDSE